MAETSFRLIYPNESKLIFCRLNKWIEYIMNLQKEKNSQLLNPYSRRTFHNHKNQLITNGTDITFKARVYHVKRPTLIQTSVVSS